MKGWHKLVLSLFLIPLGFIIGIWAHGHLMDTEYGGEEEVRYHYQGEVVLSPEVATYLSTEYPIEPIREVGGDLLFSYDFWRFLEIPYEGFEYSVVIGDPKIPSPTEAFWLKVWVMWFLPLILTIIVWKLNLGWKRGYSSWKEYLNGVS